MKQLVKIKTLSSVKAKRLEKDKIKMYLDQQRKRKKRLTWQKI